MAGAPHPDEIDRFADTARRFCKWCESDKTRVPADKLQFDALRALADVYRAGFLLPDTDDSELPRPQRLSRAQRAAIAAHLAPLPMQHYRRIVASAGPGRSPAWQGGDLIEDLLEVYADLIEGLWLFERRQVQAAVFHWRQRFAEHWGRRAVCALQALHTHTLKPPA